MSTPRILSDLKDLLTGLNSLRTEVSSLTSSLSDLNVRVTNLRSDTDIVKSKVSSILDDVGNVRVANNLTVGGIISGNYAWNLLSPADGVEMNLQTIISLADNWEDIHELSIIYRVDNQVYIPVYWNKTQGQGNYNGGYYYSDSYYASVGFYINTVTKNLAGGSWIRIYNNGTATTSTRAWIYYR